MAIKAWWPTQVSQKSRKVTNYQPVSQSAGRNKPETHKKYNSKPKRKPKPEPKEHKQKCPWQIENENEGNQLRCRDNRYWTKWASIEVWCDGLVGLSPKTAQASVATLEGPGNGWFCHSATSTRPKEPHTGTCAQRKKHFLVSNLHTLSMKGVYLKSYNKNELIQQQIICAKYVMYIVIAKQLSVQHLVSL